MQAIRSPVRTAEERERHAHAQRERESARERLTQHDLCRSGGCLLIVSCKASFYFLFCVCACIFVSHGLFFPLFRSEHKGLVSPTAVAFVAFSCTKSCIPHRCVVKSMVKRCCAAGAVAPPPLSHSLLVSRRCPWMATLSRAPCLPSCRLYPDKMFTHRKYFCGEGAQRTEAQAKTQRKGVAPCEFLFCGQ